MLLRLQKVSTGDFLVLGKDNVLTVEIHSTLFNNQDDLLGSFSYSGRMPLEPNRHILENAHLINTSADLRVFKTLAYLGAMPYKEVNFQFTIDGDDVEYNLSVDLSVLATRLKTLKLNRLISDPYAEQLSFDTREEYRDYMMSTLTAKPGTMPMVFFPYKNDGAYKEIDPADYGDYLDIHFPVNKYFNAWKVVDGVGSFVLDTASDEISNTQTPFFYYTYIIRRVCMYLGCTVEGRWMQSEAANRLVMQSNIPPLSFSIVPDFTYFMPDIGVNEWLKSLRTQFGLLIDFDLTRNVATIESFENLEDTDLVLDLRYNQLKGFRETTTTQQSFVISQAADDKDTAFTDDEKNSMPVITIGDQSGIIEIADVELLTAATKMITESAPYGAATWRIPHIKMPIVGNAPLAEIAMLGYEDRSKFKPRVLYWHGMVEDSAGFLYPYGSVDNLNWNNQVISETSLALSNTGSAVISVKRFIEFKKNSKPFEVGFFLRPWDFLMLTPRTRVLVRDRNQVTINCLLDSAAADFEEGSLIFGKATLYPIVRPNNAVQVVPVIPPVDPEPPHDNGEVWVSMRLERYNYENQSYPPPGQEITHVDVVFYFWEDAAGTIPKPVIDLVVNFNQKSTDGTGATVYDANLNVTCNGSVYKVYDQISIGSSPSGYATTFAINPNAHYHNI